MLTWQLCALRALAAVEKGTQLSAFSKPDRVAFQFLNRIGYPSKQNIEILEQEAFKALKEIKMPAFWTDAHYNQVTRNEAVAFDYLRQQNLIRNEQNPPGKDNSIKSYMVYRGPRKGLYVVGRNFYCLTLPGPAWVLLSKIY